MRSQRMHVQKTQKRTLAPSATSFRRCGEFLHSGHSTVSISADFKPPIRYGRFQQSRRGTVLPLAATAKSSTSIRVILGRVGCGLSLLTRGEVVEFRTADLPDCRWITYSIRAKPSFEPNSFNEARFFGAGSAFRRPASRPQTVIVNDAWLLFWAVKPDHSARICALSTKRIDF